MIKFIEDLWILTDHGTVVYHQGYAQETQDQMFGMLMSALNTLAEKMADGGMSSLELSDKRLSFMKKRGFIFVGISLKKNKEKKINTQMNYIMDTFFNTYSELFLSTWDGDLSQFEDFGDQLKD